MNPATIASVFAQLDRELWLVTARASGTRGGLIATFVNKASIVPAAPRVLVGLARQHHTWELIETSGSFALHLLGEEHLDRVWRFGLASGREHDKLDGLSTRTGLTGCPILVDVVGWLECRVEARLDTGDRTVYLAEVLDGQLARSGPVLTVKRLLQLAPPAKLSELKDLTDRDSAIDLAAIEAWRQTTRR